MLTLLAEYHVFAVSRHVMASMRPPRVLEALRGFPPVEVLYHGIDVGFRRWMA